MPLRDGFENDSSISLTRILPIFLKDLLEWINLIQS
jgi:hypothetical protein